MKPADEEDLYHEEHEGLHEGTRSGTPVQP
jgi:hypothetical protein